MTGPESEAVPRVAVFHGRKSAHPLALAKAAADICEILWIVDTTEPGVSHDVRLLKKIGPVVDVAGLTLAGAAKRVGAHRPAGMAVFYDEKMITASHLALRLGLPFYSPQTAEKLANKLSQRRALLAGSVPCPQFWELSVDLTDQELDDLVHAVAYPAVLKPQAGAGSQGTHFLPDAAALIEAWKLERRRGDAIVEEYVVDLPGESDSLIVPYVSVESVVSRGTISHLAVTGRFPVADGFRETGFFIPSELSPQRQREALDVAGQAVRALGVTSGFSNVEMKLTPDGPRVIEVNGRPGGGTSVMLELATGVPLLPYVFRLALGEHVQFDGLLACSKIGYLFYRQPPSNVSTVTAIEGLKELRDCPGVTSVSLTRKVGDTVDWRVGITGYVFSVEGRAEDERQLIATYRAAQDDVRVAFEK